MRKIKIFLEIFVILGILGGGFLVRLYKINNPIGDWHSWRQADTASVSRVYMEQGIDLLHPKYHDISRIQTGILNKKGYRMVEFPIFNVVHVFLAKNFNLPATIKLPGKEMVYEIPEFEVWGRLTAVISSMVATFFLYLVGKKLYGRWAGLSAAFFYAFLPYNIYFSRVILPEPMAVAFIVISWWLFLVYLEKERYLVLYLSAVFFALAMLLKPFSFFYFPVYMYWAIKSRGLKKLITDYKFILALDIALIPFFLWRVWINQFPAGIPYFGWAFNGDKIRFKPSFFRWIFAERIGKLMLGTWGLIPFGYAFVKVRDYTLVLAGLGMFLYISIIATANVRHDYYQVYLMPFVCLTLGVGAWEMWNSKVKKWTLRGLLFISLLVMFITSATEIRPNYAVNHPEIVVAGKALQKYAEKDALVIAPYNGDTAFLYQTDRWGWPVVDESFDDLIKKGARYFVTVNFADRDTAYVEKRFQVLEKTDTYMVAKLQEK